MPSSTSSTVAGGSLDVPGLPFTEVYLALTGSGISSAASFLSSSRPKGSTNSFFCLAAIVSMSTYARVNSEYSNFSRSFFKIIACSWSETPIECIEPISWDKRSGGLLLTAVTGLLLLSRLPTGTSPPADWSFSSGFRTGGILMSLTAPVSYVTARKTPSIENLTS